MRSRKIAIKLTSSKKIHYTTNALPVLYFLSVKGIFCIAFSSFNKNNAETHGYVNEVVDNSNVKQSSRRLVLCKAW